MLRAAPKNTGGPLRRLRKGTSFNLLASFRDGAAFLVEITGPEGIDGAFERGFLSVSLDRLRDSAAFSCEGLQRERRRLREVFSDCPDGCPQVVVLGAGSVQHGSESHEAGRGADEADLREVRLDEDFAIGMGEVSLGEWRVCVAEGACAPRGEPGMAPDTPVAVSFEDATAFVDWLSARTGAHYFLPSELQWEYAARAGGSTRYHWGDTMEKDAAVCRNCLSDGPPERAEPVHSRSPNLFNLFHMHGNLAEWVADCWDGGGAGGRLAALLPPGAPPPRLGEACPYRVLKGGSFADDALSLRAGNRNFGAVGARDRTVGFRVARSLR
ncbi:MAG: formylglycine-generating enzyme family protein [Pseudomonadota bacterium]